jgi:hypothetical protein
MAFGCDRVHMRVFRQADAAQGGRKQGAGTDLREGALGEDTADKSLAGVICVAGPGAAMEQPALT